MQGLQDEGGGRRDGSRHGHGCGAYMIGTLAGRAK
jgi:hypothetical protein